jgi:serine protease Do
VQIAERPTEQELARLNGIETEEGAAGGGTTTPATPTTGQAAVRGRLGMTVQALTPDLARRGGLTGDVRGVVITEIDPSSDAGQKGLRAGDIIVAVNTRPTNSPDEIASVVSGTRQNNVLLLVRRGNAPPRSIPVTLKR